MVERNYLKFNRPLLHLKKVVPKFEKVCNTKQLKPEKKVSTKIRQTKAGKIGGFIVLKSPSSKPSFKRPVILSNISKFQFWEVLAGSCLDGVLEEKLQ